MRRGFSNEKGCFALGALLVSLGSIHAHAANNRTWISGKGVDQAGCGPVATPCRTLQYAHDNTNAGGEIDVMDPAGYGSVIITKAISIINDGVGTAGVLATSDDAILISAGASDSVTLRGLTIEGAKAASNGILVKSVGSLTIANCFVQSFTGRGIFNLATSDSVFRISNTTVADNHDGILLGPRSGSGLFVAVIDRVISTGNESNGLQLAGDSGGSGTLKLSVSNSLFSSNVGSGIRFYSAAMQTNVVITDTVITENGIGISAYGLTPTATLGRNTISHNSTGITIGAGTVQSYGNNQFANNGTDVSGTLTPIAQK